MKKRLILIGFWIVLIGWLTVPATTMAIEAVASINQVIGTTQVERGRTTLAARKGLILYDQDIIVTGPSSRATLLFRDGSIIRLFPNTRFLIERSVESQTGSRQFINNIFLKLGSFWGKFTQKSQQTVLHTPTATCGIKGTEVALAEREGKLTVALTAGAVVLRNAVETFELEPGDIVKEITRTSAIRERRQSFNYQLVIRPDQNQITPPPPGKTAEIYFSLQMIRQATGENVSLPGPVYISPESDKLECDPDIQLNERGYARIKAKVLPFQEEDFQKRRLEVLAIMAGEEFMEVEGGRTVLTVNASPTQSKPLRIDAGTGKVE